tara:strand:- start:1154 stop:1462 length:309 start_codon:yes stop_codon:yes gene_type:complete
MSKNINYLDFFIDELNKNFPGINAVSGEYWDGSDDQRVIWFKGTESASIDGQSLFNPYSYDCDPQEKIWVMGTHKKLCNFLKRHGWYPEPYDNGTLFAIRNV